MTTGDDDSIVEIRTTCGRREAAVALGRRLVEERLAACVQVDGPITSVYRWQEAVEVAEEFRCTCKTSPQRAAACQAAILASHEYGTPELLVAVVRAAAGYAAWVRASVSAVG